jgi:hypothetical protein
MGTTVKATPQQIAEVARVLRGPSGNDAADKLDTILCEQGFRRPQAKRYDGRGSAVRDQRARRDAVLQALAG